MTSPSDMTGTAVVPSAPASDAPLRAFVEVKFSELGIPFAFGVVTIQDNAVYWSYGARVTGCVETYKLGDAWLPIMPLFHQIVLNPEELGRTLRSYLRNVERRDFKMSLQRGLDHINADKLNVYASRTTFVYLQSLMSHDMSDFRFISLRGVDHPMQKRMAWNHQLLHFPYSPMTWAHTAALAVMEQEASA